MSKNEIINAIKIGAFDAISKAARAHDTYFKRVEVIFDIIIHAGKLIGKVEEDV